MNDDENKPTDPLDTTDQAAPVTNPTTQNPNRIKS
jgi:hypothetical protein